MDMKKVLSRYLENYICQDFDQYPEKSMAEILVNGIEAFEAGAFDGNEYEIVIDKVTRKV